jgi:hypothetical protein
MTSTLYVDNLIEKTSGNGVHVPGHVVQVQSAETTTVVIGGSQTGTLFDVGLSCNITPKFATSKILVIVSLRLYTQKGCNSLARTLRDTTSIHSVARFGLSDEEGSQGDGGYYSVNVLDAPATTSQITYKCQVGRASGSNNWYAHIDGDKSTITLQEIAQ